MTGRSRILVVDDDCDMLHLISMRLTAAGYEVVQATSGEDALLEFRKSRPQLVVTDLRMGGMDGLALFERLQAEAPSMPVIILTAHGTIPDAVAATQRGVFSFLTKPFEGKELLRRVADAIRLSPSLDIDQRVAGWRAGVITINVRMEEVLRQALRIAEEERAALVVGPPGVGKATLVEAMHRAGRRSESPLVSLSCADFPAAELELLLNPENDDGVFARAEGGVLHLADVGALSAMGQSRLFAVLFRQMQARDPLFRLRANAIQKKVPDVQIIASTPRPLDIAVADQAFRSDLFYLLGERLLLIPPLADRPEDIPLLASHFLASALSKTRQLTLAPEALEALSDGAWPGNVRQLKNVLAQLAERCLTPVVPETLVRRLMRECDEDGLAALDDARRDFERDYLVRLLRATAGNVAQAARVAQRNRTEFYKLLARHGLDPASFKQKFR